MKFVPTCRYGLPPAQAPDWMSEIVEKIQAALVVPFDGQIIAERFLGQKSWQLFVPMLRKRAVLRQEKSESGFAVRVHYLTTAVPDKSEAHPREQCVAGVEDGLVFRKDDPDDYDMLWRSLVALFGNDNAYPLRRELKIQLLPEFGDWQTPEEAQYCGGIIQRIAFDKVKNQVTFGVSHHLDELGAFALDKVTVSLKLLKGGMVKKGSFLIYHPTKNCYVTRAEDFRTFYTFKQPNQTKQAA